MDRNHTAQQQEDEEMAPSVIDIPELVEEDDDEDMNVMDDYEPASPGPSPGTPKQDDEDGPQLELPEAKRSRLSRISMLQNFCRLDKLKARSDVREITRQLDRTKKHDNNSEKQRKRVETNGVNDVSEIYSPPRVTAMAEKMGLRAGWALDLVEVDPEDGLPWDFSTQAKREKALRKIKTDKPFVLIASPMCGPFSALQSLCNYPKMRHEEVKKKLSDAMAHIEFCMELSREQHMSG